MFLKAILKAILLMALLILLCHTSWKLFHLIFWFMSKLVISIFVPLLLCMVIIYVLFGDSDNGNL